MAQTSTVSTPGDPGALTESSVFTSHIVGSSLTEVASNPTTVSQTGTSSVSSSSPLTVETSLFTASDDPGPITITSESTLHSSNSASSLTTAHGTGRLLPLWYVGKRSAVWLGCGVLHGRS